MSGMSPHEVVRLHRLKTENGFQVLQEFSFTTDHAIHMRMSLMEDTGRYESLAGWQKIPFQWPDMKGLIRVVLQKELRGYKAVWGSGYGPEPNALDYLSIVEW